MSCTKPALSALDLDHPARGAARAARRRRRRGPYPVRLPIPPKITIAKIVSENEKPNRLGVASCSHAGEQPAGERGQRRGDAEHARPCSRTRSCRAPASRRVLADALQHPADRRLADAAGSSSVTRSASRRATGSPSPSGRRRCQPNRSACRQADQPVRAAELGDAMSSAEDHRRDGEREQDQVLDGRACSAGQGDDACRPRTPCTMPSSVPSRKFQPLVSGEVAHRVAADRAERGVGDRHLAGVAEQQVQRQRERGDRAAIWSR